MEDLDVGTAIIMIPDEQGEIEMQIWSDACMDISIWVSFNALKTWMDKVSANGLDKGDGNGNSRKK